MDKLEIIELENEVTKQLDEEPKKRKGRPKGSKNKQNEEKKGKKGKKEQKAKFEMIDVDDDLMYGFGDDDVYEEAPEIDEEFVRAELKKVFLMNKKSLKHLNMSKINKMQLPELLLELDSISLETNANISTALTGQLMTVLNTAVMVGTGCTQDLDEQVQGDDNLMAVSNQMVHEHLLRYMNERVQWLLLYVSHVANNLKNKPLLLKAKKDAEIHRQMDNIEQSTKKQE